MCNTAFGHTVALHSEPHEHIATRNLGWLMYEKQGRHELERALQAALHILCDMPQYRLFIPCAHQRQ